MTTTDRNGTYNDLLIQHECMAEFFAVFEKYRPFALEKFSGAHDVAIKEALLKISRITVGRLKDDNYVDAAAYLAIAFECEARSRNAAAEGKDYDRRRSSG